MATTRHDERVLLTLRIPASLRNSVQVEAEREDLSVSQLVRRAVRQELARLDAERAEQVPA
jgi:hypothetical protein